MHPLYLEEAFSVACYLLVVYFAFPVCDWTAGFACATMYISVEFKTDITGSELCIDLVQWRCLFYALMKENVSVFSCIHYLQGPGRHLSTQSQQPVN